MLALFLDWIITIGNSSSASTKICYKRHLFPRLILSGQSQQTQTTHSTNENSKQARENACDQVAIDFGFTCDWLSRWREFF